MSKRLSRAAVIKKTVQLGLSTIVNKGIGFIREMLTARYLGVGVVADAYFAAYRLPSSLRKIFAEGAFAGAVVPTLTQVYRTDGKEEASRVVTTLLVLVQAVLLVVSAAVAWWAPTVISSIVPGWANGVSVDRLALTASLLRILIFFIVFTSASTLLGVTLQLVNFFSVLVISQLITNVMLSFQFYFLIKTQLSVYWLASFVIFDSVLVLLFAASLYRYVGFRFALPRKETWVHVRCVFMKFLPACIGLGAVEITLIIDQIIASYLPQGSLALLKYVYAFMRVPLGLFASTFATVLLPQFARVYTHSPKRMNFYFFEAIKFVWWVSLPAMLAMMLFSYKIFYTFYFCDRFPIDRVYQAASLLSWFITGLFFFALDKIVVSLLYARHDMKTPTIATLMSAALNTLLSVSLLSVWGLWAIIFALVVSMVVKVFYCLWVLYRRYDFQFYPSRLLTFITRSMTQTVCIFIVCGLIYLVVSSSIVYFLPGTVAFALLWTAGYWLWVLPLIFLGFYLMLKTRSWFSMRIYFIG